MTGQRPAHWRVQQVGFVSFRYYAEKMFVHLHGSLHYVNGKEPVKLRWLGSNTEVQMTYGTAVSINLEVDVSSQKVRLGREQSRREITKAPSVQGRPRSVSIERSSAPPSSSASSSAAGQGLYSCKFDAGDIDIRVMIRAVRSLFLAHNPATPIRRSASAKDEPVFRRFQVDVLIEAAITVAYIIRTLRPRCLPLPEVVLFWGHAPRSAFNLRYLKLGAYSLRSLPTMQLDLRGLCSHLWRPPFQGEEHTLHRETSQAQLSALRRAGPHLV